MSVTRIVFENNEDLNEYVELLKPFLTLPGVVYHPSMYSGRDGDKPAQPSIIVTDALANMDYDDLIKMVNYDTYANARTEFDLVRGNNGRRLVDYISTIER